MAAAELAAAATATATKTPSTPITSTPKKKKKKIRAKDVDALGRVEDDDDNRSVRSRRSSLKKKLRRNNNKQSGDCNQSRVSSVDTVGTSLANYDSFAQDSYCQFNDSFLLKASALTTDTQNSSSSSTARSVSTATSTIGSISIKSGSERSQPRRLSRLPNIPDIHKDDNDYTNKTANNNNDDENENDDDDDNKSTVSRRKRSKRVVRRTVSQSNPTPSTVSVSPSSLSAGRASPKRIKPRRIKSDGLLRNMQLLTDANYNYNNNNYKQDSDSDTDIGLDELINQSVSVHVNPLDQTRESLSSASCSSSSDKPTLRRSKSLKSSKSSLGDLFRRSVTDRSNDSNDSSGKNPSQPTSSTSSSSSSLLSRPLVRSKSKSALGDLFRRKPDSSASVATATSGSVAASVSASLAASAAASAASSADLHSSNHTTKSQQQQQQQHAVGSKHRPKLPKSIKEIDGQLWRVDDKGNKIKKVRKKSSTSAAASATIATSAGNSASSRFADDGASTIASASLKSDSGKSLAESRLGRKLRAGRRRRNVGPAGGNGPHQPQHQQSSDQWSVAEDTASVGVSVSGTTISSRSYDSRPSLRIHNGRGRPLSRELLDRLDDSENGSGSESGGSVYLDETPNQPKRTHSGERERERERDRDSGSKKGASAKPLRRVVRPNNTNNSTTNTTNTTSGNPKKKKKTKTTKTKANNATTTTTTTEDPSCWSSSDSQTITTNGSTLGTGSSENLDAVTAATAMSLVADLQKKLMESQHEVWRLRQITDEQQSVIDGTETEMKKLRADIEACDDEKKDLRSEMDKLSSKLELREQDLRRKQTELENEKRAALDKPTGDHLIDQITDLMNENNELLDKMTAQKVEARSRMEKREEEVRYLQQELDRMRLERGEKDLEQLRRSNAAAANGETAAGPTATKSMQLVDKIWNQKKDVSEQTYKRQIQELRERVRTLEVANHKMKHELGNSTLEIKDDDDEETRKAKEVAMAVARGKLTRTRSAQRVRDRCQRQLSRSKSPHANRENRLITSLIKRSNSVDLSLRNRLANRNNNNHDTERYEFVNRNEQW